MTRVWDITTDNGSDATADVKHFFQLAKNSLCTEDFTKAKQVLSAARSIKLAVGMLTSQNKQTTEALDEALIEFRRGKVMRQKYRQEVIKAEFSSKEPPNQDSPTR